MSLLVQFNEVSKKYNDQTVIDQFSYRLKTGEVIALLGPSGCGKTTILNLTAGLTNHSAGDIQRYTNDIGYVFQEPRLIPWKNVLENVLFALKNGTKQENLEKAHHSLAKVGLEQSIKCYPKQLSGGMRQRVSIARALVSNPKIILMDEPFSALDVSLKRELQEDVISIIEEKNIGIVYVTHDPEEAVRMADRIIMLEDKLCKVKREISLERVRKKRDHHYIQKMKCELSECIIGGQNRYVETV